MHLFYTPDISGNTYTLNEDESKHAIKVLRLTAGNMVSLIDGKGNWYEARIEDPNPKKCKLSIASNRLDADPRGFWLHMAIAPVKNNDRFEWFIEKAVEIGIDEITPLISEHSERKKLNHERLEKIMVSAIKQSLKAQLPKLNPAIGFNEFITTPNADNKFIAHCADTEKKLLSGCICKGENILILIGPEGDFSEKEISMALANGFIPVSLGNSRLRTETAALVAVTIANVINE